MTRFALHLNDAGITLLDEQRILYRQPGYALLDGDQVVTGDAAFGQARIDPRGVQHRYWRNLSAERLVDHRFSHLSAADLACRQLEALWPGGRGDELLVAVPGWMSSESLGLLLGIAGELGIRIAGMADAAVAATRRRYEHAVPIHIDLGQHAATLSRIGQDGGAATERTEVLDDCGIHALFDTWIRVISDAFVQQSRFDPLHTAETEQSLLDQLTHWLNDAAHRDTVDLQLRHANLTHDASIETLALVNAVAPQYQTIASRLRALLRAGETPALQMTDRAARSPGLADYLRARVGGEVFTLEPGATARGALARLRDAASGEAVSLRRKLDFDQATYVVEVTDDAAVRTGTPTHILFGNTAYALNGKPLSLGTQASEGGRAITLDGEMPGVSRLHCSLVLVDGKCVVEDASRYGTYLNGHRINGSTVLQVGDTLRVGSPGFEFRLITTDETHGS